MKIALLDGFALNPGDLSWETLAGLGDFCAYDWTASDQLVERAAGADVLIVNKTPLGEKELALLPDLRLIVVTATGYNNIDMASVARRGITVCNAPDYSSSSVAQHTFALIFALTHSIPAYAGSVARGDWSRSGKWTYRITPLHDLAGKTLGVVGYGSIAKKVINIARSFEMRVLFHRKNSAPALRDDIRQADLKTLLEESDVVSLHCPLTEETKEMINRESLSLMQPSAILINTARGGLIREADLARSLNEGKIAGAGLDVLTSEPPLPTNPLIGAKNCLITPHIAWTTKEARERLMAQTVENVRAFLAGAPVNVVSK